MDRRHDADERLWPWIHSFSNACLYSDARICPGVISNNSIGSRIHRTRYALLQFSPLFLLDPLKPYLAPKGGEFPRAQETASTATPTARRPLENSAIIWMGDHFPGLVVDDLLDSRVDSKCSPTERYHFHVERQSPVSAVSIEGAQDLFHRAHLDQFVRLQI